MNSISQYGKDYYQKNKERIKSRMQNYRRENPKKIKEQTRRYVEKNSDKIKDGQKKIYFKNKELIYERVKKWRKDNPEKYKRQWRRRIGTVESKQKRKEYYKKNKSQILKKQNKYHSIPEVKERKKKTDKSYRLKHRIRLNKKQVDRKKIDLDFKIKSNLRSKLWGALRMYSKTGKIMSSKQYGVDYKAIIEHLKPFPINLKGWHIDHIKPLCTFNLTKPEEIKIAFSPENHQWLTAEENQQKKLSDGSIKVDLKTRYGESHAKAFEEKYD